jgi:AAA family ATP:ADP antiporter
MTDSPSHPEFGAWRALFWPIHSFELKKVLPMFFMFFLISFNYNLLRETKEALIITAPSSGVETILFIKSYLILPSSILFTLLYAKLSNILSKQALFYTVITPFLLFFVLFALVLYPNRELLHPTSLADDLQRSLPQGLMGLVSIFRNWTYALFFELAELWGSFMLSLLFWGFANEITRVSEAKRFYALFGIGANLALFCSGPATVLVSDIRQKLPPGVDPWGVSLNWLMSMVFIAGIGIIALYWWINRYVLTDSRFCIKSDETKTKTEKPKLSLKESLLYLSKSPHMQLLALLVICYGISINIIEMTWKSHLQILYPNPNDYTTFMGYVSMISGAVTLFMILFAGGNILQRFGWQTAALITPIVLFVTGILFFSLVLYRDYHPNLTLILGFTPLMLAVLIGTFQNVMTKACKYALFDPSKEMVYIPLDQEQKVKGKAVVDVAGARLGKSGGSFIQQALLISMGSMSAITPTLACVLIVSTIIWIYGVRSLNDRLNTKAEPELVS